MPDAIGTAIVSPEPTALNPQQTATGIETPKPVPGAAQIPEKFGGDVGKLAEAYKALEVKQSTGAPAAPVVPVPAPVAPTPAVVPQGTPEEIAAAKVVADKAAAEAAEADAAAKLKAAQDKTLKVEKTVYYGEAVDSAMEGAGLKPIDVAQEWTDNEKLSEDTYAKLAKAGYPTEIVDMYIAGFQGKQAELTALEQSEVADVMKIAGGEEGFNAMTEWAGANLTSDEVESFNGVMDSDDSNMVRLAVQGMHAKYVQATGKNPNLVQGGGIGGADVFESHQQVSIAMKAARESGDPAQIHAVERKALRSPAL